MTGNDFGSGKRAEDMTVSEYAYWFNKWLDKALKAMEESKKEDQIKQKKEQNQNIP